MDYNLEITNGADALKTEAYLRVQLLATQKLLEQLEEHPIMDFSLKQKVERLEAALEGLKI